MSEQHSMRQGLDDHEAWLDTLDKKLFVSNSEVKVEFDNPICFPLDECTDLKDLKGMARTLRSVLSCNETPLPRKYLIERFLRLVIRENRLPTTVEKAMRELRIDWNISNEYQDW
ncbi:hypothetical protein [Methylomonas sp. WH-1]|uniref:hypothetical protein n=2 Tax=Methylomonas TaxID=416 RepID=UPI00301871D3